MDITRARKKNPLGIIKFIKKNVMMLIAVLAALISAFFVKPDSAYLDYFDFKTLTCLFCVLAVVCAFKNIAFFELLAAQIVKNCKNIRITVLVLVYITFFGSMLITNDTALLTFLPLAYTTLKRTGKEKYTAFTFIMQNMAANLGGMITPFGSPQNLFLYSKYAIPNGKFFSIMLPPFLLSLVLITICCVFIKPDPISIGGEPEKTDRKKAVIYGILFAFSVALVFRAVPYYIGLPVVIAALFFLDRKALAAVDYPLLMTFAAIFVFSGNLSRIETVKVFFSSLLGKNTLICAALSSQVISNVPAAILLSNFTTDYAGLLVGVNVGGVGTIIASLASLITLREYASLYPEKQERYFAEFSAYNFGFLAILLIFCSFIL
ncbi:MAG TPA: SLC13 family permease [Oscillospiraceae bacterium]|nr:SLC13 family permease [Oscillospiraceae bacterium]